MAGKERRKVVGGKSVRTFEMPGRGDKPRVACCEGPAKRRCCAKCVYAVRPASHWLRVILSRWVGMFFCFNCTRAPGQMYEVRAGDICRNFRPGRRPKGQRGVAPEPTPDGICYIPLTQNEFAMVDAEDYPELSKYKWSVKRSGGTKYAYRRVKGKDIVMHRVIMNPPEGMVVDHIDGNGLNNRRCNLRICTREQNRYNSRPRHNQSGLRGVRFAAERGKYIVVVGHKGGKVYGGEFDDPVEAALARDRLASKLHGEFAWLNLPHQIALRGTAVVHSSARGTLSVVPRKTSRA
jgi:hypothetical protein